MTGKKVMFTRRGALGLMGSAAAFVLAGCSSGGQKKEGGQGGTGTNAAAGGSGAKLKVAASFYPMYETMEIGRASCRERV